MRSARRLVVMCSIAVAVLLHVSVAAAGSATAKTAGFRTPSGNIYCAYFADGVTGPSLRCDILSGLRPEPRRPCELDWTGLSLTTRGSGPSCAGDTVRSSAAPTLPYGTIWRKGPFACRSRFTGLTCGSTSGHGLFLSRARWRAW